MMRVSLNILAVVLPSPSKPHVREGVSRPRAVNPAPSTVSTVEQPVPAALGDTESIRTTATLMPGKSRYGVDGMRPPNLNL